jgi:hypothetical protein
MFAFGAFLVTFRSSFFTLTTFERTFRENKTLFRRVSNHRALCGRINDLAAVTPTSNGTESTERMSTIMITRKLFVFVISDAQGIIRATWNPSAQSAHLNSNKHSEILAIFLHSLPISSESSANSLARARCQVPGCDRRAASTKPEHR